MKITKEQLETFSQKVQDAANEIFSVNGIIIKDSEGIWLDSEKVKLRYPDFPSNCTIIHAGFECDLIFKKK